MGSDFRLLPDICHQKRMHWQIHQKEYISIYLSRSIIIRKKIVPKVFFLQKVLQKFNELSYTLFISIAFYLVFANFKD